MKLLGQLIAPTGAIQGIEIAAPVIRIGRNADCELAVDPVEYPKVSGLHAQIELIGQYFVLKHLSRSNKTILNDQEVVDQQRIKSGDTIKLGYTGPQIRVVTLTIDAIPAIIPTVVPVAAATAQPMLPMVVEPFVPAGPKFTDAWLHHRQTILCWLMYSLVLSAFLLLVFGNLTALEPITEQAVQTRNFVFILGVACFWFGLHAAVADFVNPRDPLTRDRYFVSSILVLLPIGLVQILLLFALVRFTCYPPGDMLFQFLSMFFLYLAGLTLGLFISAISKSQDTAKACVPFALLPQVLLAGVLMPLWGLPSGIAKGVSVVYWGQISLETRFGDDIRAALDVSSNSPLIAWGIMLFHAVLFSGLTYGYQMMQRNKVES